ncbi:MAG: 1,4-alpha-glucan branching protein GlgB [Clostridia bacterium]|nr:1,4-alpha-glucan branching protein GlgB [Clostridia bacterium]
MSFDDLFEKRFVSGDCYDAYKVLGCHKIRSAKTGEASSRMSFYLYAPGASSIRVAGDFNSWGKADSEVGKMKRSEQGFWYTEIDDLPEKTLYKYEIAGSDGDIRLKTDPFASSAELRPGTASYAAELPDFGWNDPEWIKSREEGDIFSSPVNIYEIHAGSWRRGKIPGIDYEKNWQEAEARKAEEPFLNYRELADELAEYLTETGYTHVELMPLCEHPLDDSWGYQTGSYYALTSRFGTPEDFMYFVDRMHTSGIGVIMDWVPGHFCKDASFLGRFDGTYLFEYFDENKRENPLWGTANFDYSKRFVKNFMISNALYWLKEYHIDGLRIDAVANIIYYDYNCMHRSRPLNAYGGNENLEAALFLRELNSAVHDAVPGALMVAEDSSTYPGVTADAGLGGLGFDMKWNMGWMNDTLRYMSSDPSERKLLHNNLTFPMMYAHTERFLLSLSHDETVHGKKTLLDKMYGPLEDKFAQYRTFLIYMMCHPGKKLIFMGSEFGQIMEWRFYESLEWKMLLYPPHGMLKEYTAALNKLYASEKALFKGDYTEGGFYWIDADDRERSVYSFVRQDPENDRDFVIALCNFSPRTYEGFRLGVPRFCDYNIAFSSSGTGAGEGEAGYIRPRPERCGRMPFNIELKLEAYCGMIIKPHFSY